MDRRGRSALDPRGRTGCRRGIESPRGSMAVTVPFFTAALSAWRAGYATGPGGPALSESFDAAVKLSIKTVAGARTAATLGAEREGTGVAIGGDGLILTIGYLILEAASILVVTADGRVFPASVAGFDHATGFG